MPTLNSARENLYDATYEIAKAIIDKEALKYIKIIDKGRWVYKYAAFKFGGRYEDVFKMFRTLTQDTDNRWSGLGTSTSQDPFGKPALYFAMEAIGESHTVFSELLHYQATIESLSEETNRVKNIKYFQFKSNESPEIVVAPEGLSYYFQFAFELRKNLVYFNVPLPETDDDDTLVATIFRELKKNKAVLLEGETTSTLYKNPKDCTFNRAIGNACLDYIHADGLVVDSSRGKSKNLILRLEDETRPSRPDQFMKLMTFRGRASFWLSQTPNSTGLYAEDYPIFNAYETIADQEYNERELVYLDDGLSYPEISLPEIEDMYPQKNTDF
jgi:hypothetical protein